MPDNLSVQSLFISLSNSKPFVSLKIVLEMTRIRYEVAPGWVTIYYNMIIEGYAICNRHVKYLCTTTTDFTKKLRCMFWYRTRVQDIVKLVSL